MLGSGELDGQLRALHALVEDPIQFPAPASCGSQPPETQPPGDLMPSSGIHRYCTYWEAATNFPNSQHRHIIEGNENQSLRKRVLFLDSVTYFRRKKTLILHLCNKAMNAALESVDLEITALIGCSSRGKWSREYYYREYSYCCRNYCYWNTAIEDIETTSREYC